MATKVQVTFLDEAVKVLEKGKVVMREGDWWEHVSKDGGLAGNSLLKLSFEFAKIRVLIV